MSTATETLTTTTTPPPANSGMPQNPPAAGWFDSIKDGEVKSWLANKNYPDAESAMKAHWGLERLMGADKAGRTVMLPKDDNDTDGWMSVMKKLGVPDSPDGYKLPVPKEGGDEAFAKAASEAFLKNGVPARTAVAMTNWLNDWIAEQMKANEQAESAASQQAMQGLEKEWGAEFAGKKELAQRGYREFAKQFGLDDKATLERAESVFGSANLTKFFAGLGALNGESKFAGSDLGGSFSMTKVDAQKEIDQLTADRTAGKITEYDWRTRAFPRIQKLGEIVSRT